VLEPGSIERLAEPFQRLDRARGRGTGLGLSIVRAVAEAHGGSVAVRSGVGAGSEFVLRLPLVPAANYRPPVLAQADAERLTALASGG